MAYADIFTIAVSLNVLLFRSQTNCRYYLRRHRFSDHNAESLEQRASHSRRQLDLPESGLVQHEQLAGPSKAEIGNAAGHADLENQIPCGSPYLHAVAATAVHVTPCITLDAVGDAGVTCREEAAVCQEGRAVPVCDVESVALV